MVKSDPQFAPGFNNLGLALKTKGDWGVSVFMYRDALQIDPRLAPAHFNLGEIQAGSGFLDEAIDHYRQALGVDPDFALAHYFLGLALLAKGRRDEVDDCYPEGGKPLEPASAVRPWARRSLITGKPSDCDPEWAPARNALRIPPQDEARLKEAIDHYRQAVRLDPRRRPVPWGPGPGAARPAGVHRGRGRDPARVSTCSPSGRRTSALTSNAYCSAAGVCAPWKVVSPPSSRERTGPPPPIAMTWRNSVRSRSTTPRPLASMPRRSQPHPN